MVQAARQDRPGAAWAGSLQHPPSGGKRAKRPGVLEYRPGMPQTSFLRAEGGDSHAIALVAAVALSVAAHVATAYFARDARLQFPGDAPSLTPAQRLALRRESAMRVDVVREPLPIPPETAAGEPQEARDRAAAPSPEELLAVADTAAPSILFEPPPLAAAEDPTSAGVAPPEQADAPAPSVPWQPRETVIEISSRFANDDVAAIPRMEIPDVDRVSGAPDVVPETSVSAVMEAVARSSGDDWAAVAWSPAPPAPGDVLAPDLVMDSSSGAGRAPEKAPADLGNEGETEAKAEAYFAEVPKDVAPAKPIENVLDASISVYRPRRDDGYVYFEVDVRRKGDDVLPPIPRDVVFAQDASRSIAPQRLAACREALHRAFSSGLLRKGDRFEVTAFNTTNSWAFGRKWREATPEAVADAEAFVESIRPDGNTDIYSAMKALLSLPRSRNRATIVLLVSDGVATQGDVQRDSEIIGEFSKINDGGVSVFNVGVSPRSDEYLLSMLSFCNRGGPAAMPRDRFSIPDAVSGAFAAIGSPVLADIRFSFDTSSGAVVTPKMTENLYLDKPLRIYGRAKTGTGQVVFQARGVNGGKAYDMVFDLSLGDPAPGSGDAAIAKNWARTRIYDLVADHIRTGDESAIAEMAALGRDHDIPIPFRNRFK